MESPLRIKSLERQSRDFLTCDLGYKALLHDFENTEGSSLLEQRPRSEDE
jgi:hypothetical protein